MPLSPCPKEWFGYDEVSDPFKLLIPPLQSDLFIERPLNQYHILAIQKKSPLLMSGMNENKNNEAEIRKSSGGRKRENKTQALYISLIEQIQFSFVISKSYTQLPAEEQFLRNENIAKTRFRYHGYLSGRSGPESDRFRETPIQ